MNFPGKDSANGLVSPAVNLANLALKMRDPGPERHPRAARTTVINCLHFSVIAPGPLRSSNFRSTTEAPTPSAEAPALMKSAAVSMSTPPVGNIFICGKGAFKART